VGFLIADIVEDWRSGAMALLFLSLCIPAYALAARSRRTRMAEFASEPSRCPEHFATLPKAAAGELEVRSERPLKNSQLRGQDRPGSGMQSSSPALSR
jgi:hypothetical protein